MFSNKISLIILSFNLKDDLIALLSYLLKTNEFINDFLEIIVVDNNSTDGTGDYLISLSKQNPKLIIKILTQNVGAGGGRNIGWELAKNDIIVSIDHDAWINISDINLIPNYFSQFPNAGILSFKIIHPISKELQNPHGDKVCKVANFHGAGFAIRKSVFKITEGMDSDVIYGGDELELSIKVHSAGWDILYLPYIIVFHNSRTRNKIEEINRDKGYLYGNIRLLYKFFPIYMATRNGLRYLFLSIFSSIKKYGFISIPVFISTYKSAMSDGLRKKQIINKNTIKFYNDVNLKPEFGNVPLYLKLYLYLLKFIQK